MSLAQRKLMDLLALREHSEQELRAKLSRNFAPEDVEEALALAKAKGWITDPALLAQQTAETLHRKGKGIEYINQYLEGKGLPPVAMNSELELEKARELVKNKKLNFENLDSDEKEAARAKLARLLASRGFDEDTLRKVIYEEL